jgi:hypothetical protein
MAHLISASVAHFNLACFANEAAPPAAHLNASMERGNIALSWAEYVNQIVPLTLGIQSQ